MYKPFLLLFGLCCIITSCKKADNFYKTIYDRPEVRAIYKKVYGVGDTLVLQGRLNPENGLKIQVGNAEGKIVSAKKIQYSISGDIYDVVQIDEVKLLVTSEMGVGADRPITVTSAGLSTSINPIEIIQGVDDGIIADKLQLQSIYDLPAKVVFLNCVNGKGSVFYWNPVSQSVIKLDRNGNANTAFSAVNLSDGTGAFSITNVASGGIDQQEKQLYLSVATTDQSADNNINTIYRLLQIDLLSASVTVLNRTVVPKNIQARTLEMVKPFEGSIGQVKLPLPVNRIYADDTGLVYMVIDQFAVCLLTKDGLFSYLYKIDNQSNDNVLQVWNTQANRVYYNFEILSLLPGIILQGKTPVVIEPKEKKLYCSSNSNTYTVQQYDLLNRTPLTLYAPVVKDAGDQANIPYISGSFSVLNMLYNNGGQTSKFGLLPLPSEQLLSLYYLDSQGTKFSAFPAWGIVDFAAKRGSRYAPGIVMLNNLKLNKNDLLLNYDPDGLLYMSANSQRKIVKTIKQ